MTAAGWKSLMGVFLACWKANLFPVNQMKAARRGLEVAFGWLKCSLMSLWRALWAANVWIASPDTREPRKAEFEDWKANEALRRYHHGDADESSITVQTRTHMFHVSKRARKHDCMYVAWCFKNG